jgi:hypothetical protein
MSVPAEEVDKRMARTEQRLHWYLVGLEDAKPGYHGRVFALPHAERAHVSKRASGAIHSIRNRGPRAGHGVTRTLSRLGWYMDGLRDAAPGYQGTIFALHAEERNKRKERIRHTLERLEAPRTARLVPPS